MIINRMPQHILSVRVSPKIITPKKTAVTGSKAPRIAVGVEPMYWMALVVHKNEIAVGKTASASKFPHRYHLSGTWTAMPKSSRTT